MNDTGAETQRSRISLLNGISSRNHLSSATTPYTYYQPRVFSRLHCHTALMLMIKPAPVRPVRSRSGAQMHKVTIPLWSNMTDCTRGTFRNQDSRLYWLAAFRSSRQTKCTAFPTLLSGRYKIPSCPKPIPQPNCEAFTLRPPHSHHPKPRVPS